MAVSKQKYLSKMSITHESINSISDGYAEKVTTTYTLRDRVGLVIHSIDYHIDDVMNVAAGYGASTVEYQYAFGLTYLSTQPSHGAYHYWSPGDPGVIDSNAIISHRKYQSSGTSEVVVLSPIHKDYAQMYRNMSPEGLLVHPASLYTWSKWTAAGAPGDTATLKLDIYYEIVDLDPDLYDEMWQSIFTTQTL